MFRMTHELYVNDSASLSELERVHEMERCQRPRDSCAVCAPTKVE